MKKFVALLLTAALVVVCCVGLASCSNETGDDRVVTIENKTIKIGVIGPFDGATTAKYGMPVRDSVKLAIEQLSANGILNGYTVEIIEKNTLGDATSATSMFKELIEAGAVAVVGPVLTGETVAVTTIANEEGIVMVTPSATGDKVTTESDYVFRTCFKDSDQGVKAADYALAHGYTKVAALYATGDDYSKGLYEAFKKQCEKNGITIVNTQSSTTIDKETTFDSQLTSIANSDAQLLFAPYYYEAADSLIIPVVRQKGFTGVIMGGDGYDGKMGSASDKTAYEKVIYTNHNQASDAFKAAYAAKGYGEELNVFGGLAYDAANILFKAIEKSLKVADDGKVTISGSDLQKNMAATANYQGVTGTITFDATGTKGAEDIDIMEYYVDNGEVKTRKVTD